MGKKRKLPDGSTHTKETTPEKNDKKLEIDGDWVEDDDMNDQLTKAESDGVEVEQSDMNDQLNKAMTEGNGGEIVPFKPTVLGLALPLIPKGTGCEPQVQYSKVVLVQYSEEDRLKDLEAANNIKQKFKAEQVDKHSGENIHKINNKTGTGNALLFTKKAESDWVEVEQPDMNDQLNKAMTEGNGGEIVLFKPTALGLALPLIPKGTGCEPQVQYSKVVLVQYSEEDRLKDLEAANNIKQKFKAEQVDKHSGENIHKINNKTGTGNALLFTEKAESDWVEVEQSDMNDQLNKAMTEGNGGEIVPFKPTVLGLALPLIPKGTGCNPQVQYSKVVLVQYSEEERLKDLEAVNNIKKKFEATSDMSLAMEYSKEKGEENEKENKAANDKSEDSS